MARRKLIETTETTNYIRETINDPKDFDPNTFRTHKLDENTLAITGKRKRDGKDGIEILHAILTRKGAKKR